MLSGKCALVTGGARRIGRDIVLKLAQAGADVAFTYLNSAQDARDTAPQIDALGVRSLAVQCELRDPASIHSAVKKAIATLGRVDLLVNNAGAYETKDFDQISPEDWDSMFSINVRGAFFGTQGCLPELRLRRGRVVNIGSLGGIRPWATHAHYCASKAALHMLTQASAKALAPDVTVNCVAPGMIDQGEVEAQDLLRHFAEKTPMQKNGRPAYVAEAVLFFATCPNFITGQILTVDGGLGLS